MRDGGPPPVAGLVGVPFDGGNGIAAGPRLAPDELRRALAESLKALDRSLPYDDHGDVPAVAGFDELRSCLLARMEQVLGKHQLPVVLGGDHSISLAAVEALARHERVALLWLDAHHDFDDRAEPGRVDHRNVLRRIADLPAVERVVAVGYRGFTIEDERRLSSRKVHTIPLAAARRLGADAVVASVGELPCYVSLDVDFLDPAFAPATATPVPEGAEPQELLALLRALWRHRRVVGFDLAEVSPPCDVGGRTLRLAAEILLQVCEMAAQRH